MKQALLIIDAQQELLDGNQEEQEVYRKNELIEMINRTVEKAESLGVPVVFVRDLDVASGTGRGFLVHEHIHVPQSAVVFDKKATNAFYGTKLLEYLKSNETEHLIMMGCKTENCIDTAVRMATVQGFDVTLVKDGHSTTDTKVLSAEQIIAHHNDILHGHYNVDHFSMVKSEEENVFEPTHYVYR